MVDCIYGYYPIKVLNAVMWAMYCLEQDELQDVFQVFFNSYQVFNANLQL